MGKSATYTMEIDGEKFSFNDDEDLTLTALRQVKSWYPDLGSYTAFRLAYLRGDPDALACVRWMVLRKAGKTSAPEPRAMGDFPLGEFMNSWLSEDYDTCTHCGGVDDGLNRMPGRGWNPKPGVGDEAVADPTATGSPTPDSLTETPTGSAASS